MNIGSMTPHIKSLTEGRLAGKLAWDVIFNKPKVDPNKKGDKVVRE